MRYSDYRLLFGDIHGHSNLSLCGVCPGRRILGKDLYIHSELVDEYKHEGDPPDTIDLFYEHARDASRFDFAALTDPLHERRLVGGRKR